MTLDPKSWALAGLLVTNIVLGLWLKSTRDTVEDLETQCAGLRASVASLESVQAVTKDSLADWWEAQKRLEKDDTTRRQTVATVIKTKPAAQDWASQAIPEDIQSALRRQH